MHLEFMFSSNSSWRATYSSSCLTEMASSTYRALVCRKLGDPTAPFSEFSALHVAEMMRRQLPSPTSVRVGVEAASVNFANALAVLGKYQVKHPLPFVMSSDFSGIVLEIGRDVVDIKVGDRVCGVADGAFAEEVMLEQQRVFVLPAKVDLAAAAGLPVAFGTSHLSLVHRANLRAGQVLLVLGAAGGVGLAAVQIGKVMGATVIAVARGPEKAQLLRSVGADFVVDPSDGKMLDSVRDFLKSKELKGVDIFYDPVGGKLFKDSLKLLNWGAHIIIVGFASGEVPSFLANIVLVKNWTIHGFWWDSYFQHSPEVLHNSMKELVSWLDEGSIHVHVSQKFHISEANLAFAAIQQREVLGKVLVTFGRSQVATDKHASKLYHHLQNDEVFRKPDMSIRYRSAL